MVQTDMFKLLVKQEKQITENITEKYLFYAQITKSERLAEFLRSVAYFGINNNRLTKSQINAADAAVMAISQTRFGASYVA